MQTSARELLVPFLMPLVWRDRGANPRPTAPEADALTTRLLGSVSHNTDGEEMGNIIIFLNIFYIFFLLSARFITN